jgi:hypothetical protein
MKSFWKSRRGWQPRPIKKILTVVLYVILRAMSQELRAKPKGFWPPEAKVTMDFGWSGFLDLQRDFVYNGYMSKIFCLFKGLL